MVDDITQLPQRIRPRGFTLRLLAPLTWSAIILWLSLTPSPPQFSGLFSWDKLLHAGAYGLLTVLLAQFLLCLMRDDVRLYAISFVATVTYGGLLEILQLTIQTGRTAEWLDLLADAVGALLACVLFRHISRLWSVHHE